MLHHRVLIWAGLVLAANWLSVALLDLDNPSRSTARVGYFLGSLSAQATLAAAWSVFGPGRLSLRVPLSIIWAALLPAALVVNIAIRDGHEDVYPLGACLLGQWLLLQVLFAGVSGGLGLRLGRAAGVGNGADEQRFRFGVRDLLILMTICSFILGLGRLIVPRISLSGGGEVYIFIFLAVAAIVVTFPLLVAALLRSNSLVGVLLSLLLITVATGLELPILETLEGEGPTKEHFIAINLASAVLILVIASIIRLGGYRLFGRRVVKAV